MQGRPIKIWTSTSLMSFYILVTSTSFHVELAASAPSSSNATEWVGISRPCLCQEFRCLNGTLCLHKSKVCSGFPDCLDGEDEVKERCQAAGTRATKNNCRKDEFKCKFGGCIEFYQVCDKKVDCWGGVDEALDFCSWVNNN